MDWDKVHSSFLDELGKIAEVNMANVSAETATAFQPPPMETPGLQKAREVLARAQQIKLGAASDDDRLWDKARDLMKPVAGGAGAGALLGGLTLKKMPVEKLNIRRSIGAGVGGALGALDRVLESERSKRKRRRVEAILKTK